MERSGDFVNDNGTFAYAKVPRSNWNSTLILLKAEGSFKAVVAVWLQQFAPALLERRPGPGALTGNWNFGMKKTLLLVTASLIALSAAAPASAADLAARPYTKAPPPDGRRDLRLDRLLYRYQRRRWLQPQLLGSGCWRTRGVP